MRCAHTGCPPHLDIQGPQCAQRSFLFAVRDAISEERYGRPIKIEYRLPTQQDAKEDGMSRTSTPTQQPSVTLPGIREVFPGQRYAVYAWKAL